MNRMSVFKQNAAQSRKTERIFENRARDDMQALMVLVWNDGIVPWEAQISCLCAGIGTAGGCAACREMVTKKTMSDGYFIITA